MSLLEDQHGPEAHSSGATGANIDGGALHRSDKRSRVGRVKGDVCSVICVSMVCFHCLPDVCRHLPAILASEVLDLLGVLAGQLLKLSVENVTNTSLRIVSN